MADDPKAAGHESDDEQPSGYKAPAEKTIAELQNLDQDDESLVKYKESLGLKTVKPVFPEDPRRVIVTKLSFCPNDREEMSLDLTGGLDKLKDSPIAIKEGCKYRIKVHFYVQHEIVSGLRYQQQAYRKGIKVDKDNYMVGSYGPSETAHIFTSPEDEAPAGMMSRGSYKIKSLFTDDDKNKHLEWEWKLDIKSDWK